MAVTSKTASPLWGGSRSQALAQADAVGVGMLVDKNAVSRTPTRSASAQIGYLCLAIACLPTRGRR